jgi:plasmid maintenance system antidote protein VapI
VTNLLVDMLTEELEARQLTQEEFAARLKMPYPRVKDLFSGKHPTTVLLEKIGVLFGIHPATLKRLSRINLDEKGNRVE